MRCAKESKELALLIGKIREGPQFKWHLSWIRMNDRISVNRQGGKAARLKQWCNYSQEIGERTAEAPALMCLACEQHFSWAATFSPHNNPVREEPFMVRTRKLRLGEVILLARGHVATEW